MKRVGTALLLAAAISSPARAQVCETPRPTDPGGSMGIGYGAAEVTHFDSPAGLARVHYALAGVNAPPAASTLVTGVPDAVVVAAQAADDTFATLDELGFAMPLDDAESPCASNGGSAAIDIYLLNFSAADGQIALDHCREGTPKRCAGFALVENDFRSGGYADAAEGLRTVVPHELFHLVQDAYDSGVERWWAEGSAQWAAKHVYPELPDLERFLPAYFDTPWRPLNVPPTGVTASFLYATAIWPVFLEQRFDVDVVREVYEGLGAGERNVMTATDQVLQARGSSLAAEFMQFAVYNAATGTRAPAEEDGYADAASYPMVTVDETLATGSSASLSEIMSGFGAMYYAVRIESPLELSLEADSTRVAATLLPLVDGRASLAQARELPTTFTGEGIVVVAGQSSAKTDAPFTLRVQPQGPVPVAEPGGGQDAEASGCSLSVAPRAPGAAANTGLWLGIVVSLLGRLRARSARSRRSRKDL